ncbi:hypothetical protein [Streptomyces sp. NPDC089919]|uniref:hypothetical protein n=1 Tax=Streptomyces sp. NPDC089919 TaxID=3155188 RepID=UPI00343089E8
MRRFISTLGSLAAAAVLVIGLGGSAHASSGSDELHLNGYTFHEPHGCYTFGNFSRVTNHTDNPAVVFAYPYCFGPQLGIIPPGDTAFLLVKRSVWFG